jgi:hypothetical protein
MTRIHEFKIGDKVRLNIENAPEMLVEGRKEWIDGKNKEKDALIECIFLCGDSDGTFSRWHFHKNTLIKIEDQ